MDGLRRYGQKGRELDNPALKIVRSFRLGRGRTWLILEKQPKRMSTANLRAWYTDNSRRGQPILTERFRQCLRSRRLPVRLEGQVMYPSDVRPAKVVSTQYHRTRVVLVASGLVILRSAHQAIFAGSRGRWRARKARDSGLKCQDLPFRSPLPLWPHHSDLWNCKFT